MKKTITYTYVAMMLLTLTAFVIFSFFKAYNAMFCEGSLLVSLAFTIAVIGSKIDPVFKITLMFVGSVIAVVTYFIFMIMPAYLNNNIALFICLTLILVEVIAVSGARLFSKFA